jgi:1-phosphofructokinase family hexose kinase
MITALGLSPSLDVTYRVDTVVPGAIHRPRRVLRLAGGKSLNAARAAVALGGDVRAIVPLGGAVGEWIATALRADGVRAETLPVTNETRSCVSIFDDSTGDLTEFYEPVAELRDDEWSALARAVDSVTDGWLALSGSVPASRATDLAALLAGAAERGIRVAVDTHGAPLRAMLDAFAPAVVKVNRAEAVELLGDGAALDLARGLLGRVSSLAIVTDGAAGAVLASAEGCLRAAPPERGRFTVGSGDCFLGGLLVALDDDRSPADALALATVLAAANTITPGAAVISLDDVERLRRSVIIDAA